jgi:hypothetical protein
VIDRAFMRMQARVASRQWSHETARRWLVLSQRWIAERGMTMACAAAVCPVACAQTYQPKGWVWHDSQDGKGSPGLNAMDKRQHFAAGLLTGSWVHLAAEHYGLKHPWLWGLITGCVVGYLKEVYDLRRGSGTAEVADALWVGAGGGVSVTILSIRW